MHYYEGEYNKHEASKIRIQDINKQLKAEANALKIEQKEDLEMSEFNQSLKTALNYNPKEDF
jgi:hypothetical protein